MRLKELHQAALTTPIEIEKWLLNEGIRNYTIRKDLTVDVEGDADLVSFYGQTLPVQFNRVTGYFGLSVTMLSLKGCPKGTVRGFSIAFNDKIKSLEGCPQSIDGDFILGGCTGLKNFKGGPKIVKGDYRAQASGLESLEGLAEEIHGKLYLTLNTKPMPILDILKVKYLREMVLIFATKLGGTGSGFKLANIMEKWIKEPYGNKRIIGCQSDLIDAGLEDWAEFGDYE